MVERGAGEILLTSWDRDGTRSGYELDLLGAVGQAVTVPVIASGGAANPEHLIEALKAGVDAVLAASIFHDGEYTVRQSQSCAQRCRCGGQTVIIPSIDLQSGVAVQLVGGKDKAARCRRSSAHRRTLWKSGRDCCDRS